MDISRLQIDQSKMLASGAEYFKLFEKHLPTGLDSSKTVLVYEISNLSCIKNIIELNPEAKYIVVGSRACNQALKKVLPKYIIVEYLEEFDFKETDMKFDCIIMNPPYQRNLHLKILAEAIKHLKDEKSVCVNLSPVRWLQDPIAKYKKTSDLKKFEESIAKKCKTINVFSAKYMNTIFNIANFTDLAIYVCYKDNQIFDYSKISIDYLGERKSIFDKVMAFCNTANMSNKIICDLNGICVKFNTLFGGHNNPYTLVTTNHSHPYINGKTEDGRTYADCAFKKKDVDENKQTQTTVKFDTIEEAKNFIKTVQTSCFMFINSLTKRDVHVSLIALPWLGDAVNPRTGLKGYKSDWTDDDLYKFFNLTQDEIKIIEDTMKKYEAK